jgi:hypothetical protein
MSDSGGIGFCGLLCVAFIVLKLCEVINWSWWWVLSPLWIPLAIIIVVFICVLIFMVVRGMRSCKR